MELRYHKDLPVLWETDVLVVGGGCAGCIAATTAGRAGRKVTLVERYGYPGGTSTGVLDTFYGLYTPGAAPRKVVGGVPDEVVALLVQRQAAFERPNTYGAGTGITYNPDVLKVVWEELLAGAGVELLYHSFCVDAIMEGNRIRGVVLAGKAGLAGLVADVVIDATGDADVSARAGAPFEYTAGPGGKLQALTTIFRLANVDTERARMPQGQFIALMQEANRSGRYRLPREEGSVHRTPVAGVMLCHLTRVTCSDPLDPVQLARAEAEGRRQVMEYTRFLRDWVPGYERAELVGMSTFLGIRESRRVLGEYQLRGRDVLEARRFADEIALCGAPIEDHHAGRDTRWEFTGGVYGIPYRCLVPRDVNGLLVAGRCLSADHDAHASARNMGPCMAMGQAAGAAAALAAGSGKVPRNLDPDLVRSHIADLGAILC